MNLFPRHKNRNPTLWVLFLSMVLLCVQSVKLHVHTLGHEHHQTHDLETTQTDAIAQHSHLSDAHLSLDSTHGEHHNKVSELDVNSDGFVNKITSNIVILALIAALITLLLPGLALHLFHRRDNNNATTLSRYLLSPPLRAPPL